MLIRDVQVDGRRVDVRVVDGVVDAIGDSLSGTDVVDGRGAALLPGLHDHHIHLLATAAAHASVDAGPPTVRSRAKLQAALSACGAGGWLRAVNYVESVAGDLDRDVLDALRRDVPVRVQHRSGALWILNSAAVDALGLDGSTDLPEGVERDTAGRVTGRLWRLDGWLGARMRTRGVTAGPPDLAALGSRLASTGITGVTDATPSLDPAAIGALTSAHLTGALPQRLTLLAADAERVPGMAWRLGPAKIVVADHALPGVDELAGHITSARAQRRAVAVHCVTHASLLLTLAALDDVGVWPGDRIEHCAVAPPATIARIAERGLAVVTQPSLPARRGDDYLDGSDADDRSHLWPYGSLLAAGVGVACSSDAPYGDLDPWTGIGAATARTTASGRMIGVRERVDAATALAGYLAPGDRPGGPPRRVTVGVPADLALLEVPLREALADPDAAHVRATLVDGRPVYGEDRL